MTRYRLVIARVRNPFGPWRESRREALRDALNQGFAWRDEHDSERVLLHPLAHIQRREP